MAKKAKDPPDIKEKARLYFEEHLSVAEIAAKYDTYPKKIQRELTRAGHKLRSKSEAQKIRLDEKGVAHPTKGKNLSDETKLKISDKLAASWRNISDEERERRAQVTKERWASMTEAEKLEITRPGFDAIQKTAVEGSKFEKHLSTTLSVEGFLSLTHQKHTIRDERMHLDILLPHEKIAVEVDGPSHYRAIWSDNDLEKSKERDEKKNGLLMDAGFHVIRVAQPSTVSQFFLRKQTENVLREVRKLAKSKGIEPQLVFIHHDPNQAEENNGAQSNE